MEGKTSPNAIPYLFFENYRQKGSVIVKKLNNGSMLITGFGGGQASNVNFVYKFNPKTQIAELVYFNSVSNLRPKEIPKPTVDKIEFNSYLPVKEGLTMLATFMGIPLPEVKDRFKEIQNCNEVLFNRSFASLHPKINMSFRVKGQQPPIRYMYDYSIETDEVELSYTNDGQGHVWAKWNDKK